MNGIRRRTLRILATTLAVVFAVSFGLSAWVVWEGSAAFERGQLQERSRAAAGVLRLGAEAFARANRDYAEWDATWDFAKGLSDDYVGSDLTPEAMANMEVDAVLIQAGPIQRLAVQRLREPSSFVPMPDGLLTLLQRAGAHGAGPELGEWDGSPWLLSSRPILRSDLRPPAGGTLTFGRRLDAEHLEQVGNVVGGTVRLRPPSAAGLGRPDPNVGRVPMDGAAGNFTIELRRPPSYPEAARQTMSLLAANMGAMAVICAVVVLWLLDKAVLQRITRLAEFARRIRRDAQGGLRLPVASDDELDGLADAVNGLLDEVEHRTQQLRHQALHDPLTGLANRALLGDRLEMALHRGARADDPRLALVFIDLDRFKLINDTLGHAAGDRFIVELGERFASAVRPADTVARLGGDEFAVVLVDVPSPRLAVARAETLLRRAREPLLHQGLTYQVSASIGVAIARPGETAALLLREADIAMYEAKAAGWDRVALYDEALHGKLAERLTVERALEEALWKGQVAVYLQPVVTLVGGRVVGFEALCRWTHAELGVIPPSRFVAVAEETKLIVDLDRYVMDRSLAALARLRTIDPEVRVNVNASARQLDTADFVSSVLSALETHDLSPGALTIELTETQLARNEERWLPNIRVLVDAGVRFALDDFGLGYSSLSRLRHYPVSVLKLDREFVAELDHGHEAVTRAVIGMARELGRRVVAEGVETDAQRERLAELGCDYGQGYHFGAAMPPNEAERVVRMSVGGRGGESGRPPVTG